jgi:hypothetical protein
MGYFQIALFWMYEFLLFKKIFIQLQNSNTNREPLFIMITGPKNAKNRVLAGLKLKWLSRSIRV